MVLTLRFAAGSLTLVPIRILRFGRVLVTEPLICFEKASSRSRGFFIGGASVACTVTARVAAPTRGMWAGLVQDINKDRAAAIKSQACNGFPFPGSFPVLTIHDVCRQSP